VNEQRFFCDAGLRTDAGRIGPVKGSTPSRVLLNHEWAAKKAAEGTWRMPIGPFSTSLPLKCAADRR
jgi:hypothetical protein